MSDYNEYILCFDAKVRFLASEYPFTERALNTFLIKTDVDELVSVENASLFNNEANWYQEGAINQSYPAIEENIPEEYDAASGYLWVALEKLNQFIVDNQAVISQKVYTVAISVIENTSIDAKVEDAKYRDVYEQQQIALLDFPPYKRATPSGISSDWVLLGYDIVEGSFGGMMSGLSNCGYNEDEIAEKNDWVEHLNRYHLFDSLQVADEFRKYTNARVSEHAPFYVFWNLSD